MLPHLLHFLRRALVNLPSLVSTNWLYVADTLGIFLATQIVKKRRHRWSWREMISHWGQNLRDGLVIVTASWVCLFGLSVAKTVYEDHESLVAANRTLASEAKRKDAAISALAEKLANKATTNTFAQEEEERARAKRKAIREQLGKFLIEAESMKLQCEHWKQGAPPSKQHVIEWSKGVYAYLSKNLDSSYAAQFLSPPTGLPIAPVGMPDEVLGIWEGLDIRITVLNKFIEELR